MITSRVNVNTEMGRHVTISGSVGDVDKITHQMRNHQPRVEALEWLYEMATYAQSHTSPEWRNANGADFSDALSQASAALDAAKRNQQ